MAAFFRLLFGVVLLPACWGMSRTLFDSLMVSAGAVDGLGIPIYALLGGIITFAAGWLFLSHPVKTYVLGHELTHVVWGLAFGAHPSKFRVSKFGGSVNLSKSNFLITLSPYFFPFYTVVVLAVALVTSVFVHPLPVLPLWYFLVGFTWSFHVLFTLETLCRSQPDVNRYGCVFSWSVIFLANVLIVLIGLALATPLSFHQLGDFLLHRFAAAYSGVAIFTFTAIKWVSVKCFQI